MFVFDFASLVLFCLGKVFGDADVQAVVAVLADLWTSNASARALAATDPFRDWQTCAQFAQRLAAAGYESTTLQTSAELRSAVDSRVSRVLLERVAALLCAFSAAYSSASEPQLTLAATMQHIQALYVASEGFDSIQRALEVAWSEMEQPLFVLAHVLHPHLRLRGFAATDVTKRSKRDVLERTRWPQRDATARRSDCVPLSVAARVHRGVRQRVPRPG